MYLDRRVASFLIDTFKFGLGVTIIAAIMWIFHINAISRDWLFWSEWYNTFATFDYSQVFKTYWDASVNLRVTFGLEILLITLIAFWIGRGFASKYSCTKCGLRMERDRGFTAAAVLIGVVLGNALLFQAWWIVAIAVFVAAVFVVAYGPKRWVALPEDQRD